ncbi:MULTISPECIES: LysE family translocator [unclassified Achromobacter]|uniref:LysE family translocator n=1 Tax=unclassified Achromobacter TaxID=2626865 RepID=UPI000B51D785|nr:MULTISPECIES: LysE family translocator [unclassified Achromobacter]OWT74385.1 threonine transporter RhtB [Achromobacter sp. HZ34]OWT78852.1 threonine transporter RhtB [Achromobacter sp. HZ28]
MPDTHTLLSFFGIAVLLALTPGPDNLFVLMQSALWGRRAGLLVVLGLCTGLVGHTAAVAAGLAALLAAWPTALVVLRLCGAAYLLYLAWQILRSVVRSVLRPHMGNGTNAGTAANADAGTVATRQDIPADRTKTQAPANAPAPTRPASAGALYRRGIIMNLTNPKVVLFFLAFLPQFTVPAAGPAAPQIVLLGVLFMLATLLVFSAIAICSGAAGAMLQRSPTARRALDVCAGVVFLGLALRLAFSR